MGKATDKDQDKEKSSPFPDEPMSELDVRKNQTEAFMEEIVDKYNSKIAKEVFEWLNGRDVESLKCLRQKLTLVTHPDYQKKEFDLR